MGQNIWILNLEYITPVWFYVLGLASVASIVLLVLHLLGEDYLPKNSTSACHHQISVRMAIMTLVLSVALWTLINTSMFPINFGIRVGGTSVVLSVAEWKELQDRGIQSFAFSDENPTRSEIYNAIESVLEQEKETQQRE